MDYESMRRTWLPFRTELLNKLAEEILHYNFVSTAARDKFQRLVEGALGPTIEVPKGASLEQLVRRLYTEHPELHPSKPPSEYEQFQAKRLQEFAALERVAAEQFGLEMRRVRERQDLENQQKAAMIKAAQASKSPRKSNEELIRELQNQVDALRAEVKAKGTK
jgi:hypothetical protein